MKYPWRWAIAWSGLVGSIVGIITFGVFLPSTQLWMAKKYARYKYRKSL